MDSPYKPHNPYNDLTQEEKDFLDASMKSNTAVIMAMLNDNITLLDMKNTSGRTALMYASMCGDTNLVKYLISQGAVVDETDDDGKTALMFAAAQGKMFAVELLIKKGAVVTKKDNRGHTAIMEAATYGWNATVGILLKNGAVADEADNFGVTPLMFAQRGNKLKVIKLLERTLEEQKQQKLAEAQARFLEDTDFTRGLPKPMRAPRQIAPRPKN